MQVYNGSCKAPASNSKTMAGGFYSKGARIVIARELRRKNRQEAKKAILKELV